MPSCGARACRAGAPDSGSDGNFHDCRVVDHGLLDGRPGEKDLLNTISTWPIAVQTVATKAAGQVKLDYAEGVNGQGNDAADEANEA
jgi:hypothetical protein